MNLRTSARRNRRRVLRTGLLVLPAFALAGCNDDNGPVGPITGEMELVDGPTSAQVAETVDVTFRLLDGEGEPFPDQSVSFNTEAEGGSVSPQSADTDADGQVEVAWTLGTRAELQELRATAAVANGGHVIEADPAAPDTLEAVGGDGQLHQAGTELSQPLEIAVRDEYGNGVPGEDLTFAVTEGEGVLADTAAVTESDGIARAHWTLGETPGEQAVEAQHDLGTRTFTAEALHFALTLTGAAEDERFLTADSLALEVEVSGDSVPMEDLQIDSDLDGQLGTGAQVTVSGLSPGTHELEAHGFGASSTVTVRVFEDLWELYQSEPAQAEVDRIEDHFDIVYVDGSDPGEQWADYGYDFNPGEATPSKLPIIAQLDVLRRQRFEEPPTFIGGEDTVYEWLRSVANTIEVDLGRCGGGTAWGDRMTLNAGYAYWELWDSGDCGPSTQADIGYYSLGLIIHEGRHLEDDDPGHQCSGTADMFLEDGSGYAWDAKYQMWIYEYSLHDPPALREGPPTSAGISAETQAESLLSNRICEDPIYHSEPAVQNVVDELMGY